MRGAWEIKKPHIRVGIICAIYALYTNIFLVKSQDLYLKTADFCGFYIVISSP